MPLLPPLLLLLLCLAGTLGAPVEPSPSPFLEGLDDFLAAFGGLALPGDPLAAPEQPPAAADESTPPPEPAVVTEVALCLGCVEEVETGSAELGRVARLAADLLEPELNVTWVTEVTEVYRAARQVVNGIKYFLTLELAPTNCSLPREEGTGPCVADRTVLPGPELYAVELLEHPQGETAAELLLFAEVSPEEVAGLPGLLSATEPPPPSPPPPSDPPAGLAGLEGDLAAMVSDMERLLGPPPAGEEGL